MKAVINKGDDFLSLQEKVAELAILLSAVSHSEQTDYINCDLVIEVRKSAKKPRKKKIK